MRLYVLKARREPHILAINVKPWGSRHLAPDGQGELFRSAFLGRKRIPLPGKEGYGRILRTFYGFDRQVLLARTREALEEERMMQAKLLRDASQRVSDFDAFLAKQ